MEQTNIVGGHWVQVFEFGSEHTLFFVSIFKFYIDQKIANQVRSNKILLLLYFACFGCFIIIFRFCNGSFTQKLGIVFLL